MDIGPMKHLNLKTEPFLPREISLKQIEGVSKTALQL
jgi:hypothetical protein